MASGFLDRLKQQQAPKSSQQTLQLIYLISIKQNLAECLHAVRPVLQLYVAERHANGLLEGMQAYQLQASHLRQPPRFLNTLDCTVLTTLQSVAPTGSDPHTTQMPLSLSADCLQPLLDCGRAYLNSDGATQGMQPLQWGESINSRPEWYLHRDGSQQLIWQLPGTLRTLECQSPCYMDIERQTVGRILSALTTEACEWVQRSPCLHAGQVAEFVASNANPFKAMELPLPISLSQRNVHPKPRPCLRLDGTDETQAALSLQFLYAVKGCQWRVGSCLDQALTHTEFHQGEVLQLHRDAAQEQQVFNSLLQCLPSSTRRDDNGTIRLHGALQWQQLMLQWLPEWRKQGWLIDIAAGFYYHYVTVDHYHAHLQQTESHWFDVALGIDIDGETHDLMPLLQQCAARHSLTGLQRMEAHAAIDVCLPDGRRVCLPAQRVAQWLGVLVELYDRDKQHTRLRLPLSQLPRLTQLEDAAGDTLQWRDEQHLLAQARQKTLLPATLLTTVSTTLLPTLLTTLTTGAPQLPTTFRASLRAYQMQGVMWLQQLKANGCGGILADDMGLGKTVQTLAHIAIEQAAGRLHHPVLIVVPTSLLGNWQHEAAQFAPALQCAILHGATRHQYFDQLQRYQVLLTTYQLLVNDIERWQTQALSLLILDEAQAIKNAATQAACAVKTLTAEQKLCLSGTPLENHLGELWSLFDFIMPDFLDSKARFQRFYQIPIEKEGDTARTQALLARVAPFMLRRRKDEVATELPPKTEVIVRIALHDAQRDLYETLRTQALGQLQNRLTLTTATQAQAEGRVLILNALLQLRQLCCDPQLTGHPDAVGMASAKRHRCMEMLTELVDEGRSVLVFSQFTRMLDLLAQDLSQAAIPYLQLTGKSPRRDELVKRFQAGAAPVFLISLKAGGTGLNLTRADSVIHYDPWWNSAAEQQATDRAYRIGQDKPVFVYKLLTEHTVEEKILALQQHKRTLLDAVYQAAEHTGEQFSLDNEALLSLLRNNS